MYIYIYYYYICTHIYIYIYIQESTGTHSFPSLSRFNPGHVSVGAHGGLDLRGIEMKPELGRWGIPKIYEIVR
jgi:hypothetical protein